MLQNIQTLVNFSLFAAQTTQSKPHIMNHNCCSADHSQLTLLDVSAAFYCYCWIGYTLALAYMKPLCLGFFWSCHFQIIKIGQALFDTFPCNCYSTWFCFLCIYISVFQIVSARNVAVQWDADDTQSWTLHCDLALHPCAAWTLHC